MAKKRDELLTIRLPQRLKCRLAFLAGQSGDTLADVANELLERAVGVEERRRAAQAKRTAEIKDRLSQIPT